MTEYVKKTLENFLSWVFQIAVDGASPPFFPSEQEHSPPACVSSGIKPHDPHAEHLLRGRLPAGPYDERPDDPSDP